MYSFSMSQSQHLTQLSIIARQIARIDAERAALVAERDAVMRHAKAEGASWAALQEASGMHSPTAVARSLRRGAGQKQSTTPPDP